MIFDPAELEQARKDIIVDRALAHRKVSTPIEWYEPHAGQVAFHTATHLIRGMTPGNRWGKTSAMGAEAHYWATGKHPYQTTPNRPVQMLWIENSRDQFRLIVDQLRALVLGTVPTFADDMFRWPNGSTMLVSVAMTDSDYVKYQGISPDITFCNEEPPKRVFRELVIRQGVNNAGRICIGATATAGDDSWMEQELYQPWLSFHAERGLTEAQAIEQQLHPRFWFWPYGSHSDNTHLPADKHDIIESSRWASDGEDRVRKRGGFFTNAGAGLFDLAAMDWMAAEVARLKLGKGHSLTLEVKP